MSALDSFEQHLYSIGPLDRSGDDEATVWELWDAEYRHERPDRMRIIVRTAWVGEGFVDRRPSIGIHIGEHAWSRDLPSAEDAPWACSRGGVTEMPRLIFAPVEGETAEYIGLEIVGNRTAHVVKIKRPAIEDAQESASDTAAWARDAAAGSRPGAPGSVHPPTEWRYWIESETFVVLRMEVDFLKTEGIAATEVREFSAFDTPREIFPPAACATPTA